MRSLGKYPIPLPVPYVPFSGRPGIVPLVLQSFFGVLQIFSHGLVELAKTRAKTVVGFVTLLCSLCSRPVAFGRG